MATSSTFDTTNTYIKYRIVVTETSTSVSDNTSTVNVKVQAWRTNNYTTNYGGSCSCSIDGVSYSSSWSYPDKPIKLNSYTELFNRDVVISHNDDGTKSIYVSASIEEGNVFHSSTNGFTVSLTNIPRKATITSAPNFNDTENPVLKYTNSAGGTVTTLQACISLDGSVASISYRDISKTGNSYTFNLTSAERDVLRAATTASKTRTVYYIIKTVLGGNTYYTVASCTLSIINANPTITGISYLDTNNTTTTITGDDSKIIQNTSTVRFNFTSLAAYKYASLVNVEVTINAVTKTLSLSGSTTTNKYIDFGAINSSSDVDATIKLTDSRGNITTYTVTITMLEWSLPTGSITLGRLNNFYDETRIKVQARYSSIDGQNTLTIQYQYKKTTDSTYCSPTTISNNTEYSFSIDNRYEWNVRIILSDRIGQTTYNAKITKGIPLLFFDTLRNSIGVNRLPIGNNSLETDGWIAIGGLWQNSFRTYGGANNNGVSGYVRAARIEILDVYANVAIEIKLYRRSDIRPVVLYLRFANENSIDPDVSMLGIENVPGVSAQFKAFAYKRGTSKWDIYAIKSEAWDDISIVTSIPEYMKSKIDVTYEDDLIVSVPSGAVEAVIIT